MELEVDSVCFLQQEFAFLDVRMFLFPFHSNYNI